MRLSSMACNVGCESDVFLGAKNLRRMVCRGKKKEEIREEEGDGDGTGDGWI
jgi:hypothetical protein